MSSLSPTPLEPRAPPAAEPAPDRANWAAHEQLEDLIQGLDAIVWEMDVATSKFTFVSERAEHILGYPTRRWLEEPNFWQDVLLHADDRAWALDFRTTAMREARDHEFVYRVTHANGHMVWLRDLVRVTRDERGQAVRLRGVMINVSQERHAVQALQEREAQLAEAQAIAGLGSWEWEIPDDRITWSEMQFRLHGEEPRPVVDYAWFFSHVHPDDQQWLGEWMNRAVATGELFEFPYRVVWPDGQVRWLFARGRLEMSADGRPVRMVGTSHDITAQRLAEQALIASEESYRTIFQLAGAAIWVHDLETGAFLDVNQTACELYGYSVEEQKALGVEGISWGEPPYTIVEASRFLERASAGEPQRFEWLGRHKNGSEVWAEVTLRRVTIGQHDRLLATARSITEQKAAEVALRRANEQLEQRVAERTAALAAANRALEEEVQERKAAEELLRQREEHFRTLIENAHDITSIIDSEGRLLYTTPAFQRILGYATDELLGQCVFDYYHPDDVERDLPTLRSLVENPGTMGRSEHRLRHKDGSWRHLEAFGRTVSPHSADEGVVVNIRDITEHKRAEEALRRSEEHFRRLIENSSDYVMIIDPSAAITYVGPSVERILGYAPEELIGSRPPELVHPDDVPITFAAVEHILAHPGEVVTAEFRIRHKNGSWRTFESFGRTLSPHSADEGIVANARDVTERRRAEIALAQAKEEAERANRAKSDFLSRMSHELRTPMNSVLGFAQLLDRIELPPEHKRGVQHILKAGRHLLQLINEVLELSRIEAGRQNFSLEPVKVGAVLREAIGLVRPLAAQWRIELDDSVDVDDELFVQADRQRLTQVVLNLLSNAIKYNRPGGRVCMSVEQLPSGHGGSPGVRIHVEDTGCGIAPDKVDLLFTPFVRLGAEQSEVEGTGLGLALSQRLVEAMGGRLLLERSGFAGSVFCIELQRASCPLERLEEPHTALQALDEIPHAPATLLYIEDNLANLSLVETILLARPQWRIVPALQGQIGVELAREHAPDLILLDLHLPDINGDEVLRRLRADPRTAQIPVVVISADATSASVDRLRRAGSSGYLTKPLDIDEFLNTCAQFLPAGA